MDNRPGTEEHPVAFGLIALVGVALVVGLILGLAALAGSRVVGVGDESASDATPGSEVSMFLPRPQRTTADNSPEITLAPGQQSASSQETGTASESKKPKKEKKPARTISLSAGQTSVAPMQEIDLTGVYPGGEGAILQVQRFENGRWEDFPASPVSVSDQTFSTYVQTGQPGVQRFRVVDTATGKPSNEVRVTIS